MVWDQLALFGPKQPIPGRIREHDLNLLFLGCRFTHLTCWVVEVFYDLFNNRALENLQLQFGKWMRAQYSGAPNMPKLADGSELPEVVA